MRPTALFLLSLSAALMLSPPTRAQKPDFAAEIRPLLQKRCTGCHGAAMQSNGLRLDDGPSALKGGYSGPALIPGNAATSRVIQRVSSTDAATRMPPGAKPLPAAEIELLRRWIDSGAEFPASAAKAVAKPKSTHWSFQPVRRPALPEVKQASWARNPIDRFVLARLEKEGWTPSPEADKITLLRRVSLDLTGLPPTAAEVARFTADGGDRAYEDAVDRLLQSPRYGEKWARHWLDNAHYADSDGYEKDLVRQYAWRYRNWVIDALNADMPYDRFTVEQLAGDQLPNATVEQRVATGFLRNTLTNREAGVDRGEARFEQLINRANTVGTVWLGLAVGCAQCHDHKYDPITQKDYYRLMAFFDRADERDIDAPLAGERGPYEAAFPAYQAKRNALLAEYEVPSLMPVWEDRLRDAIDSPGKVPEWDFALTSMKAMFDGAVRVLQTPREKREARDQLRLTDYFVERSGPAIGLEKAKVDRLKDLRKKLGALDKTLPPLTQAYTMVDDPAAGPSHLRVRGQWDQMGVEVEPGAPAFLHSDPASMTRLELARWLVSADNPLTARVAVNRAWQEFFGRGLVRTSEDFGVQGEAPSHPQLLDWLASEFVAQGWSNKKLHKTIVMSATYRQASHSRPGIQAKDPENVLLARQSRLRLPAELVRDSALAAAGLLDDRIGGPSVHPPQPAGVAELRYGNKDKWMADTGPDRYRRGLYIHFQRTTPYPMLMNFDSPDSNTSCTRRGRSNTPLQALNLMNDEVFHEAAQALSRRIAKEAPAGVGERIDFAFRSALARAPTTAERARMAAFHDEQARINPSGDAWTDVSRVLLNLDEFVTRE
ncbi:MAG: PSD1 and planctomycete cytochrome C domain-containing protein [Bryobacteraceae bacterium]